MSCKFCLAGCYVNEKYNCCFECEDQESCIKQGNDCKGMPKVYKECNYYLEKVAK